MVGSAISETYIDRLNEALFVDPAITDSKGGDGGGDNNKAVILNIINLDINLSMSIRQAEQSAKRRTSERRRLKLLKNLNEFKINNPYRSGH